MAERPAFPLYGDNFKVMHPSIPFVRAAARAIADIDLAPSRHHTFPSTHAFDHWPPDRWEPTAQQHREERMSEFASSTAVPLGRAPGERVDEN